MSYASLYIPPDKFWMISVAGLIYPWVLALNFIFCLVWFFVKPKFILLSFLSILLGWGILNRFIQLQGKETDEQDIKVVSYNVRHFTGSSVNASRDLAELIKGFLNEKQPDIICLQEVMFGSRKIFNLEAIRREFKNIKHYQYASTSQTGGSVTMTRYPIINMEEIRFENSGNIALSTDVVAGKDTIRIFNVHLQSYRINPDKYRIIDSPGISSDENRREARELGIKYRKAVKMRAVQARLINEKIKDSPYQVLVCGDFNDTPASYAYQKVRGKLRDSFVDSGEGIGNTYIGKLPSFRIDYILHSKLFESYNFKVHDVEYSDHRPVSCDLIRAAD